MQIKMRLLGYFLKGREEGTFLEVFWDEFFSIIPFLAERGSPHVEIERTGTLIPYLDLPFLGVAPPTYKFLFFAITSSSNFLGSFTVASSSPCLQFRNSNPSAISEHNAQSSGILRWASWSPSLMGVLLSYPAHLGSRTIGFSHSYCSQAAKHVWINVIILRDQIILTYYGES